MKYLFIILLLFVLNIQVFSQDDKRSVEVKFSNNQIIKGSYTIYYKEEIQSESKITRPIIICEGFDISNKVNPSNIYFDNQFQFLIEPLRKRGYDVLILNLETNPIEIEKNAALFVQMIKDINAILIQNQSYSRITTIGISMGGLLTKMALAQMERDGIDHRVERYISFDSPHRGANIPLGYQHMIYMYLSPILEGVEYWAALDKLNLNPFNYINNGFFNENKNYLIQTAAFEMSAVLFKQNIWRQNFLSHLDEIGEYPQNCRKIAISNGVINEGQGFDAGSNQFEWHFGPTVIDEVLEWPDFIANPAKTSGIELNPYEIKYRPISWETQVNAMPGNSFGRIFHAGATIQLVPNDPYIEFFHYNRFYTDRDYLTAPLFFDIDHVPGGYFSLSMLKELERTVNTGEINIPIDWSKTVTVDWIPLVGTLNHTFSINKTLIFPASYVLGEVNSNPNNPDYKFCFVPIMSSLDIIGDWYTDVSKIKGYPYINDKDITPFDAIYAIPAGASKNTLHAHLEYVGQAEFLLNEIAPEVLYIQNQNFKSGYTNIFSANTIYIGRWVDPNSDRNLIGDVTLSPGVHVEFHVPKDSVVYIKPGFNTNGGTFIISRDSENPIFEKETFIGFPNSSNNKMITSNYLLKSETVEKKSEKSEKSEIDSTVKKVIINSKTSLTGKNDKELKSNPNNVLNVNLKTYPNPVLNNLYINIQTEGVSHLYITLQNAQGKIVKEITNSDISVENGAYFNNLDVSNLEKGIYFLNVQYGTIEKTDKVIIQ